MRPVRSGSLDWASSQAVFDPLRPSRSVWDPGDDDARWDSPTGAAFDAVPVFSVADVIEALEDDREDGELSKAG